MLASRHFHHRGWHFQPFLWNRQILTCNAYTMLLLAITLRTSSGNLSGTYNRSLDIGNSPYNTLNVKPNLLIYIYSCSCITVYQNTVLYMKLLYLVAGIAMVVILALELAEWTTTGEVRTITLVMVNVHPLRESMLCHWLCFY